MLEVLKANWKLYAVLGVLAALLVMWGCWEMWGKPAPKVPEVYKPAIAQTDGSVVLEKKPDPGAVVKQQLPPGAKVERMASVTVQPRAATRVAVPVAQPASNPVAQVQGPFFNYSTAPCPPVTVDLSLVRMPDKTRRVIASSPDGAVVGGVDIPVDDAAPAPAPRLWAAGIAADPLRRIGGVFVDRDLGFLRLGVQVNQRELGGLPDQLWVKAGIRW